MALTLDFLATQRRQQVAHGVSRGIFFHLKSLAPDGNAVKDFPIEYPAVLALATDFVTSVASAKTAGTPDNMCLKPFTALPGRGGSAIAPLFCKLKICRPINKKSPPRSWRAF